MLFIVPFAFYALNIYVITFYFHDYMFTVLIFLTCPLTFFGFIPFLEQPRWVKSLGVITLIGLVISFWLGFSLYVNHMMFYYGYRDLRIFTNVL